MQSAQMFPGNYSGRRPAPAGYLFQHLPGKSGPARARISGQAISGWRYRSYPDLLTTIHAVNADREPADRIRVHAVSTPAYWAQIETPEDFATFTGPAQASRDAKMYAVIYRGLNQLSGKRRRIFLTYTRHAYNDLHRADGNLFWNTATYFRQWHPGHSVSIRFNGPYLNIERQTTDTGQGR